MRAQAYPCRVLQWCKRLRVAKDSTTLTENPLNFQMRLPWSLPPRHPHNHDRSSYDCAAPAAHEAARDPSCLLVPHGSGPAVTMTLAARSRRPGEGQSPLPPHRTDEPDGRDTLLLDAVVFGVQVDPPPSLHLRALKLLLLE